MSKIDFVKQDNGLYRIVALRDIINSRVTYGYIKKGTEGGLVESFKNINMDDESWIEYGSEVTGDSLITGNSFVSGESTIKDSCVINCDVEYSDIDNSWVKDSCVSACDVEGSSIEVSLFENTPINGGHHKNLDIRWEMGVSGNPVVIRNSIYDVIMYPHVMKIGCIIASIEDWKESNIQFDTFHDMETYNKYKDVLLNLHSLYFND